ncbi:hypothetical protein V6N13_048811 [Hibiscus sabdariffa]|uniref:NAC domain-containing protein n=1 Tax=Hibiscus sabdariffa TaxID=183260 RepID=A0ABR2DJH3_9ROSI
MEGMGMAPGFRFYPTEEELVSFYLHNKLEANRDDLNNVMNQVIPVVHIYDYNPWDLPKFSVYLCHKDPEQWFFFIPRQESEARGGRPKRLTTCGYWKATGSPGYVYSFTSRPIGVKRTMVFYNGRAPHGNKTDWKMNEYKAIQAQGSSAPPTLRQEFSLCRVYKKSKFVRSFDRRPPLEILKIEGSIPRFDDNHINQAIQIEENDKSSTIVDAGDNEFSIWDVDGFWNPVD